jgi:hypothetical protein
MYFMQFTLAWRISLPYLCIVARTLCNEGNAIATASTTVPATDRKLAGDCDTPETGPAALVRSKSIRLTVSQQEYGRMPWQRTPRSSARRRGFDLTIHSNLIR